MVGEVGVMHLRDLDPVGGNTCNHQLMQATTAGGREAGGAHLHIPIPRTTSRKGDEGHARGRSTVASVYAGDDRWQKAVKLAVLTFYPKCLPDEKDICAGLLPHLTLLPRCTFYPVWRFYPVEW